jgi:hypothetical protein
VTATWYECGFDRSSLRTATTVVKVGGVVRLST